MSDLSAEDYARVAVAIGMKIAPWKECAWWWDGDSRRFTVATDNLAPYLAEPAQMVRILKLDGLPGEGWALSQHGHYWIAARMKDLAEHDAPVFRPVWQSGLGEAVRDCAARALRP